MDKTKRICDPWADRLEFGSESFTNVNLLIALLINYISMQLLRQKFSGIIAVLRATCYTSLEHYFLIKQFFILKNLMYLEKLQNNQLPYTFV